MYMCVYREREWERENAVYEGKNKTWLRVWSPVSWGFPADYKQWLVSEDANSLNIRHSSHGGFTRFRASSESQITGKADVGGGFQC